MALGTQNIAYKIIGVVEGGQQADVFEGTHHESAGVEKLVSSLVEEMPVTVDVIWQPGETGAHKPTVGAASETVTFTIPKKAGQSAGASIAGAAQISEFRWRSPFKDRKTARITIQPNVKFTYTAATASGG